MPIVHVQVLEGPTGQNPEDDQKYHYCRVSNIGCTTGTGPGDRHRISKTHWAVGGNTMADLGR